MLNDRETNFVYMSGLLPARHPSLASTLERIFEEHQVDYAYLKGTKDIWCRDYMPVQVDAKTFVRYRYCPDYLQGLYKHLITNVDAVQGAPFQADRLTVTRYVIDGGNLVHSKNRACMTDKVYRENPSVSKKTLQKSLEALFDVELIVVPQEPYDEIGHTDGMIRFVDDDTVVVNDYRKLFPSYHARLVKLLASHGLSVVLVPYRPSKNGRDWQSAWGNYVNYLQVGQSILIPQYQIPSDHRAKAAFTEAFREAKVIGVDCRGVSLGGGVLNCVTWNVKQKPAVRQSIRPLGSHIDIQPGVATHP